MSRSMVISEDDAIELLAFLVTSSRGVIDEEGLYGSFRLIDAAGRLLSFALDAGEISGQEQLRELKSRIDETRTLLMTDEDAYKSVLEDAVRMVAKELRRRSS